MKKDADELHQAEESELAGLAFGKVQPRLMHPLRDLLQRSHQAGRQRYSRGRPACDISQSRICGLYATSLRTAPDYGVSNAQSTGRCTRVQAGQARHGLRHRLSSTQRARPMRQIYAGSTAIQEARDRTGSTRPPNSRETASISSPSAAVPFLHQLSRDTRRGSFCFTCCGHACEVDEGGPSQLSRLAKVARRAGRQAVHQSLSEDVGHRQEAQSSS